jgi:hypothetical protein
MSFLSRFLFLLLFAAAEAQVPSTPITEVVLATVTSTISVTSTVSTVCMVLVNASDPCRRKRNMWSDKAIILAFDDSDDDLLDDNFVPTKPINPR